MARCLFRSEPRRSVKSPDLRSEIKKISESAEWSEWSEWDSVKLVQVGIRIGNGEGLEIRGKVVSWMRF